MPSLQGGRVTDRRLKLLALLWSLDILDPAPEAAKSWTKSGPGPARKQPCEACGGIELLDDDGRRLKAVKGTGWQHDKFGRRSPCVTCGGNETEPGTGWIYVDRMVGDRQVRTAESLPTRPPRMVPCDACHGRKEGTHDGDGVGPVRLRDPEDPLSEYREPCHVCGGSGTRPIVAKVRAFHDGREVEPDEDVIALDPVLAKLAAKGSYPELVAVLRQLSVAHPKAYETIVAAHVDHTAQPTPGTLGAALCEYALRYLEVKMPEKVRVPREIRKAFETWQGRQGKTLVYGPGVSDAQRLKRDKEIRRLILREEKPSQWVAAEYGLSVASVNRIVAGVGEEAVA